MSGEEKWELRQPAGFEAGAEVNKSVLAIFAGTLKLVNAQSMPPRRSAPACVEPQLVASMSGGRKM